MARIVERDVVCPDCKATVGTVASRRGIVIRRHTEGPLKLACIGSGMTVR